MPIELFYNELSTVQTQLEKEEAREFFKKFVGAIRALAKLGPAVLNTDFAVNDIEIGTDHTIASLRNDQFCAEERIFLKALQNKSPYARLREVYENIEPALTDYRMPLDSPWPEAESIGLGHAHLYNGIAISFWSHEQWRATQIVLTLISVDQETNELAESPAFARNCSSADSSATHLELFQALLKVRDGEELWLRRTELLPNLRFIPRVREQLLVVSRRVV